MQTCQTPAPVRPAAAGRSARAHTTHTCAGVHAGGTQTQRAKRTRRADTDAETPRETRAHVHSATHEGAQCRVIPLLAQRPKFNCSVPAAGQSALGGGADRTLTQPSPLPADGVGDPSPDPHPWNASDPTLKRAGTHSQARFPGRRPLPRPQPLSAAPPPVRGVPRRTHPPQPDPVPAPRSWRRSDCGCAVAEAAGVGVEDLGELGRVGGFLATSPLPSREPEPAAG